MGRARQGTIVAARPPLAAAVTAILPDGVVDAMTGNPDPALLPSLAESMNRAVALPQARYGDPLVASDLALAAEEWFAADGIDANHLTVVSGALDALERVLSVRCRPGDRIGVEDPGYSSVHRLVSGLGYVPVAIGVDDVGVRLSELADALGRGLDALVVTPRAHNPTGAAFTPQRAADLSGLLDRHRGVFVVEDDHAGLVAGVDYAGIGHDRPHWVIVRSVAKSLGPDLRLALVVGDRETIDRVDGRLQIGPGWVSHLLQHCVADLLHDPVIRERVRVAHDSYAARRERLLARLAAAGVPARGRSGLHVWVPVPDEQIATAAMRERGFVIRSGAAYRINARPAVRVTSAALTDDQIDDIAAALASVLSTSGTTSSRTA